MGAVRQKLIFNYIFLPGQIFSHTGSIKPNNNNIKRNKAILVDPPSLNTLAVMAAAKIWLNPSRVILTASTRSWFFFTAHPQRYIIHRKLVLIQDMRVKLKPPPPNLHKTISIYLPKLVNIHLHNAYYACFYVLSYMYQIIITEVRGDCHSCVGRYSALLSGVNS